MADRFLNITGIAEDAIVYQRAVEGLRDAVAAGLVTVDTPWTTSFTVDMGKMWRSYDRARELLLSCLDDEQRADYEAANVFSVRKGQGLWRRTYRISEGIPRVCRVDHKFVTYYCVVIPMVHVPVPDAMLAIKMMIESDEKRFLEIANITGRHRRTRSMRFKW